MRTSSALVLAALVAVTGLGSGIASADPAVPTGPWIAIDTGGDSWREFSSGPVLGPGVSINQQAADGATVSCAASWPVSSSKVPLAFLTAGHCDQNSGGALWMYTDRTQQNAAVLSPLTHSVRGTDRTGAMLDAAYTPISRAAAASGGYRTSLTRGVYVRGVMPVRQVRALRTGTPLCMVGARSGVSCGPITATSAAGIDWGGRAVEGDSGGAVFAVTATGDALAVGMLQGGAGDNDNVVAYLQPALDYLEMRLVVDET